MWRGMGGVRGVWEAGEEGGGKWDSQGGRKQEKLGEIMQHYAIFCNQKKRKEAGANKNRAGTGI